MNNKLSFTEVLEKITVGDFADGECGVYKFLITKLKNGRVVFLDEENGVDIIDMDLNKYVLESAWEIRKRNDLLTTGQMIDRLKVGDIAKTVNRIKDERVCKNSNGFYWCDSYGNPFTYDSLKINDVVADLQWEILSATKEESDTVSFEEAMRAVRGGKSVRYTPCKGEEKLISKWIHINEWFCQFNWGDLYEGDWQIVG